MRKTKNIIIKRSYIGTQDMQSIFAEILKNSLLKLPALMPIPNHERNPWEHEEYWCDSWQFTDNGEFIVEIAV